eukprot:5361785-Amphidinium_carterae.1
MQMQKKARRCESFIRVMIRLGQSWPGPPGCGKRSLSKNHQQTHDAYLALEKGALCVAALFSTFSSGLHSVTGCPSPETHGSSQLGRHRVRLNGHKN